jgi:hypothetical protein
VADERDAAAGLRAHIDAAHAAADRLVREAQQRAEESDRAFRESMGDPPPRGWEVPHGDRGAGAAPDLQAVVALLDSLRHAIPAELTVQLADALREMLLAVRAVIDWYIDRLERAPRQAAGGGDERVRDIPIR